MEYSFLEILILVLIGLLFFKETVLSWVAQKFGFKDGSDKSRRMVNLQNTMSDLKLHFNDKTTHILTEIQVNLSEGFEKLDEKSNSQCKKLDAIISRQEEMLKYGVKTRR